MAAPQSFNLPPMERLARWFTLDTVWWTIVPACLLMLLNISVVHPNDFWWHARMGQIIVTEHFIPTTDAFTFTRYGQSWINQAWLMQVALYGLYQVGGLPLVIFAHALTITAGYGLVLRAVTRQYGLRPGVLAILLGASIGILTWVPRPQIISYLFFGLLIYWIEQHRHGRHRALWGAVPLFAVWVNSHGGFVFGLGALGFYIIGQLYEYGRAGWPQAERPRIIRLAALGCLAVLALALNPQGPIGIIQYVWGFLQSNATVNFNVEFAPLSIRQLDGMLFWAVTVLLVILAGITDFRPRPDQVLAGLVFATLALLARRNVPWYGFVIAPMLAAALQAVWKRTPVARGAPVLNGLLVVLLGMSVGLTLPWVRPALPLPAAQREWGEITSTPVEATAFMCATLPAEARVLAYLPFSSYQEWACPRLPVFNDTRFELYPLEQWLDYMAIDRGRFDWQSVAEKYGVTHLFFSVLWQPQAIRAVQAAPCWVELYRDEYAMIFARTCR